METRSPQYLAGRREAEKAAITFLHNEADRMSDQHARSILHSAAFGLGVYFSRARQSAPLSEPAK